MTSLVDLLQGWLAAAVAAGGPTLVFGIAGAVAGAASALVLALLCRAATAWLRGRGVRVSSLAARGATRAEIARRTGLSQDAVGMLLCVRGGQRGRRNLPAAARIAASRGADVRRRNRDWNPQVIAGGKVRAESPARSGSARALPSLGAAAIRLTRSGQAA